MIPPWIECARASNGFTIVTTTRLPYDTCGGGGGDGGGGGGSGGGDDDDDDDDDENDGDVEDDALHLLSLPSGDCKLTMVHSSSRRRGSSRRRERGGKRRKEEEEEEASLHQIEEKGKNKVRTESAMDLRRAKQARQEATPDLWGVEEGDWLRLRQVFDGLQPRHVVPALLLQHMR